MIGRRARYVGGGPETPEAARTAFNRAVVTVATLEAPGALALAAALVFFFDADNGLNERARMIATMAALASFAAYSVGLFLCLLLPAAQRLRAAQAAP